MHRNENSPYVRDQARSVDRLVTMLMKLRVVRKGNGYRLYIKLRKVMNGK